MIESRYAGRLRVSIIAVAALIISSVFGSSAAPDTFAPRNKAELKNRMELLRKQYKPYLRSLPKPIEVRSRTAIHGPWVSRYEVEKAEGSSRPVAPGWFHEDYDDGSWEKTSVPEWRFRQSGERAPVSCILWYRTEFAAELPKGDKRVFLVFEGVDWEAEVWLNGQRLGSHSVYYEPFRFDVTSLLKTKNTLAVRVIDGPIYGEPAAYWSLFPVVPSKEQRYVRDKFKSLIGNRKGDLHIGSGYGIHREVYLQTTGIACITDIFVRGDIEKGQTFITTHADLAEDIGLNMDIELIPENFEGKSYRTTIPYKSSFGEKCSATIPMPEAKRWTPETPFLYRCRVTLRKNKEIVDGHDVLFGYRSFGMVSEVNPRDGLPSGMLLLNGEPVFLRGTNIQGLNALWYWNENDKLMDLMLMLKAGNFNAVRSCQHVQFPEVRELQDRLGIMSQQDNGSRYPKLGKQVGPQLVVAAGALTRVCYNNPGVVLISYSNETSLKPAMFLKELIDETLKFDPDRIIKPVCGGSHGGTTMPPKDRSLYNISDALWANVIADFHPYWGWYGWKAEPQKWCRPLPADRMLTAGEYGAEALDSYETMSSAYPSHWKITPSKDADVLCGQVQTAKAGSKQIMGFRGKKPANLGQYIVASQNYQADVLSEQTKTWRMSPRRIAGYFQFHFVDVLPANWPKSIVSHDLQPKKGYYEMAQINQPLIPLPRLVDDGNTMQLWVANDLSQLFDQCLIRWAVRQGNKILVQGEQAVDVPAYDALQVHKVDLSAIPTHVDVVNISLVMLNSEGALISQYEREVFLGAWRKK